MAKREEGRSANFVVIAVVHVDVFSIEDTAALGAPIQEGGIVFNAGREGKRKFAGLLKVSHNALRLVYTVLTGVTSPNRTSAMALPFSLPPYHSCIKDFAFSAHGIATGVPLWRQMTAFGFASRTFEISSSV